MGTEGLEEKLAHMEKRLTLLEQENKKLKKAKDVHDIQNIMSLHEYYHASFKHQEELDAIWAQQADDVSFEEALFQARFVGLDAITRYYVQFMRNTLFASARGLIQALYPQLEAETDGDMPFGMAFMHTLTTPVIEVAGDGETAKGAWISPGYMTMPTAEKLQAYWHWDKYGVDFIKEEGKWKIWHFFVGRDFTAPYEKSWVDTVVDNEEPFDIALSIFKDWWGSADPHAAPKNTFESYSPFKVPRLEPRLPEPYRTFSETFSY
jgi:hypothetical protein